MIGSRILPSSSRRRCSTESAPCVMRSGIETTITSPVPSTYSDISGMRSAGVIWLRPGMSGSASSMMSSLSRIGRIIGVASHRPVTDWSIKESTSQPVIDIAARQRNRERESCFLCGW